MPILVTGANGNIGSNVIETLRAQGHSVRATARDVSTLSPRDGVDIVHMDLTNPPARDFLPALDGVRTVFLYPALGRMDGFLQALSASDVEHVVLLSSPDSYEPVGHQRIIGLVHQQIEQGIARSGVAHTVLYPSWLATNALRDWGAEIRTSGTVSTAYPDAHMTPIHIDDVAHVAADLLTSPTFRGRFQILTGPRSMTLRDMIGTIADIRGQTIDLIELTPEQATTQRPEWLPADVFDALLDASAAATGIPAPINNTVERITGGQPKPFSAWVESHRDRFVA
jgi:uncharacterized protein YbjT (DUF2867 family)